MIAPYSFLPMSITGTATIAGTTVPFRVDPANLFKKLELAGAVRFEAWKQRWGLIVDDAYLRLGSEGTVAASRFDLTSRQFIGVVAAGFRPLSWRPTGAAAPSVLLEVDAGMRLSWMGTSLTLDSTHRDQSRWFPEFLGSIHVPIRLTEHWAARFRGTVDVADELGWELEALAEYECHPVAVSLGYLFQSIEHAGEHVAIHVDMQSIYLEVAFRFGAEPFYP